MFTLIVLSTNAGFSINTLPTFDAAKLHATDLSQRSGNIACIYDPTGLLVWRYANDRLKPPVANKWRVVDSQAEVPEESFSHEKNAIRDAKSQAVHYGREFHVLNPEMQPFFVAVPNPRSVFRDVDASGCNAGHDATTGEFHCTDHECDSKADCIFGDRAKE